jgi:hypothetical protein
LTLIGTRTLQWMVLSTRTLDRLLLALEEGEYLGKRFTEYN